MRFVDRDLSNQFISRSYQDLVQQYLATGSLLYLLDGYGTVVFQFPSASFGGIILTQDQTASISLRAITSSYVTLTGTDNYLPKWSNNQLTVTSSVSDDGTVVSLSTPFNLGPNNHQLGIFSITQGNSCLAQGSYSHAQGNACTAIGNFSHAQGDQCNAQGVGSHAEGFIAATNARYAHAEGNQPGAFGDFSHAEGNATDAFGTASHAEGTQTLANGDFSHAEGEQTTTNGRASRASGLATTATGNYSMAHGSGSTASGILSIALGNKITVSGTSSIGIQLDQTAGQELSQSNTLAIMGGNVGIGTLSPINRLDVFGNISASVVTASFFGTSSWSSNSVTASYAKTASVLLGSVASASYAGTASVLLGSVTSASYALSASYAISSSVALTASFVPSVVPIGGIISYLKSFTNTPTLSTAFVECNGQTINDSGSIYNGQATPNLNGSGSLTKRFLRGSITSGTTGGLETGSTFNAVVTSSYTMHTLAFCSGIFFYPGDPGTQAAVGLLEWPTGGDVDGKVTVSVPTVPPYYEVVYVLRIK